MTLPRVAALLLITTLAYGSDPTDLVQHAKQAMGQGGEGVDAAITLLEQANQQWDTENSRSDQYADALDYLAILLACKATAGMDPADQGSPLKLEAWKRTAAPYTKRALEIRESRPDTKPEDLALALELEADVLDRDGAGMPDWDRAFAIRAKRVATYSNAAPAATPEVQRDLSKPPPTNPILLQKHDPAYNDLGRQLRLAGNVDLQFVIGADGLPRHLKLTRNLGYGLDEKAAEAVRTWRFLAGTKDGVPVPVRSGISLAFKPL